MEMLDIKTILLNDLEYLKDVADDVLRHNASEEICNYMQTRFVSVCYPQYWLFDDFIQERDGVVSFRKGVIAFLWKL